MTTLAIVVFWFIAGVAALQAVLAIGFVRALGTQKPPGTPRLPKAAVILCLRGADPYLDRCIRALLDQDYPEFEVRIVVDSQQDPAWDVVKDVLRDPKASRVVAGQLQHPRQTCSLKCSSVAQAIRELDDSCEVVALIDADTIAHPTWLRELVAPLADPQVGAATGNRWYMPETPSLGSLVRYAWNVAAVVIMYWCRIAWGGTLAVKRSAIERADLLTHWQNAFCEDTMLFSMLRKYGLRQVFVPTLMMVNRESCTFWGACNWISRQLLTARLYHPGWIVTILHCGVVAIAPLLAFGIFVASLTFHSEQAIVWSLWGMLLLQLAWVVLLVPLEWSLRRIVAKRGEPTRWMTPTALVMLSLAIVATQIAYPLTLLKAMFIRTVEWRGVRYRIRGPWRIRLNEYSPFRDGPPPCPQNSL